MRRGQIGLQCQRALVTPERLGVASDCAQGSGEVGLYCCVGRLQLRRRPDEPQCLLRVPERRHGQAHEVQGVATEGLTCEHLAIHGHGLGQMSLAVERARLRERGTAVDHGSEDRACRLRRCEQPTITPLPAAGNARPGRRAPPSAAQARARSDAIDRHCRRRSVGGPAQS